MPDSTSTSPSTCVVVGPARNGTGLFAAQRYEPTQIIVKIQGRILHSDTLWDRGGRFAANCIRFGPWTYLDPGDRPCRYANHSCRPNAGIRKVDNQLFLFAARTIAAGKEIVFDYSTTIGDDDIWTMRCNCGELACRGKIKRFGSLPDRVKGRYLRAGLVPKYIVDTLR